MSIGEGAGIEFDTMAKIADKLMTFKYVLKNVAWGGPIPGRTQE